MCPVAEAYTQHSAQSQRQELILTHLPLVRHVIGRLQAKFPRGTDVENLEAAGVLGLVEAASRFEPQRGTRFETFAFVRIRGAVLDELRRNCPLPQQMLKNIARVRAAYGELSPPVTVDQLVAATGLSADEVADCLSAVRWTRSVSWDHVVSSAEQALSCSARGPVEQAEIAEQKRLLANAIQVLPERERLVVTLYYLENLRLKEIGAVLEMSESGISKLLKTALFNLGEYMRARAGRIAE